MAEEKDLVDFWHLPLELGPYLDSVNWDKGERSSTVVRLGTFAHSTF